MKLIKDIGRIYPTDTSKRKSRYGIYECPICTKHFRADSYGVKRGNTTKCRSCSSTLKNKTHGLSRTKIHNIWVGMNLRCNYKSSAHYNRYGGRGIKNLFKDFETFYKWAFSNGYKEGLSIDRIDNDGNYEPSNCQFITSEENTSKMAKRENYGKNMAIKISIDDASEICEAYDTGMFSYNDIGKFFDVHSATIGCIVRKSRFNNAN